MLDAMATTYTNAELLVKIREALANTLDRNYAKLEIAGRTLDSFSLKELGELERQYTAIVNQETSGNRNAVVARFRTPG